MAIRTISEEQIDKVDQTPIIPGTEKRKSIFSGEQNKAAGFAVRMEIASKILNDLEDSGFDPVNLKDVMVDNFPIIPDAIERLFLDGRFMQYNNAKLDFGSAQLRQETGAQINESEFGMIDNTYFPLFVEDTGTRLQKRKARSNALEAMKRMAGAAYDAVEKCVMSCGSGLNMDEALTELKKRAKTNPELKQKLIEKGLIDE